MKKIIKNQKGFTLIEIIAVLVILGILAAVAVPKYADLQKDAQAKSLDTAFAAGVSEVTQAYARFLLENDGAAPTGITGGTIAGGDGTTAITINTDLGEFTAAYAAATGNGASGYEITLSSTDHAWVASIDTADKKHNFEYPW